MATQEQTVQLDIPVLLPQIEDTRDGCVRRLEEALEARRGVLRAHVVENGAVDRLCVHYDPDLVTLAAVKRIARNAGAVLTERYPHLTIPFSGLEAADMAMTLGERLAALPGVLHAHVNYAAGLAFVAYDRDAVSVQQIVRTMRALGAEAALPATAREHKAEHEDERGHDHGSAPLFLPHWMQERWRAITVALAGLFLLAGWLGERFLNAPPAVSLILFALSYLFGGYDIARHAIPGLLRGRFDTDVLMLAAAAGAAVLGEWAEGAFLLFLFSLAHAGEHYALDRARNAIHALGALMPATAQVRRGGQVVEEAVETLAIGDVVLVRPGDRVPVDGEIVQGHSTLDQSAITGESMPVEKGAGDAVYAGTINETASIDVRVTRLAADNTLSRVLAMVAEAQSQQSPSQQMTQRFMRWFVPAVLGGAVLVAVIPALLSWLTPQESVYRALLLLVAASPCALAVGTPATVLAGIAQAARHGVLIKGGAHLEKLGAVKAMAFDKTGTLTTGEFVLSDIAPLNGSSEEELLRVAASVEQQSNHPLALALVRAARERALALPEATPESGGLEDVPGQGVRGKVGGDTVVIGRLALMTGSVDGAMVAEAAQVVQRLEAGGKTTMAVSSGDKVLGVVALADDPRAEAAQTMQALKALGVEQLVMLTGDNEDAAQRIGRAVQVTDVRAGLLPEEKLAAIRALREEAGSVAMTGDGVNDAPALAAATVGIAMGGAGTAVALETADVALMADDLSKLPFAVGLSRQAVGIIRQNLWLSLGVIVLLILTSVSGLIALSGAVALHEGSTILVVLNALRLLRYR